MPQSTIIKIRRFDFFGFAMLALAVASLQMMLDRGAGGGWFESPEIWLYLGLAISRPLGVRRPLLDGREPVRRPADVQATATS